MTSGIYGIRHKPTGHIYIGSAIAIERRFREHKSDLARGKHDNRALQESWNRYGADTFVFIILEVIPREQSDEYYNERETYHIARHKNVYNQVRTIKTRTASGDKRKWYSYARFFALPANEARAQWELHITDTHSDDCEVCEALTKIAEFAKCGLSLECALERIRDEFYSVAFGEGEGVASNVTILLRHLC